VTLASRQDIDRLAGRIREAYRRRGRSWHGGCSTDRLWETAALVLIRCHDEHPEVPIDPELFVISQSTTDPWTDLASSLAAERYRQEVGKIIARLRAELGREIRRAEEMIHGGRSVEDVVGRRDAKLSPLGRYIVACRAFRPDLADDWSREALIQHESCPLYRHACCGFLPVDAYPNADETMPSTSIPAYSTVSSLN
jgi:hypothetical protein